MNARNPEFSDDRTARERRRKLTDKQIKDLELAGGVEGGMQAGSAGGPGQGEAEASDAPDKGADRS